MHTKVYELQNSFHFHQSIFLLFLYQLSYILFFSLHFLYKFYIIFYLIDNDSICSQTHLYNMMEVL